MLWLKAFHIVFVVTWFAGLFYLPRLFVYHAMSEDTATVGTLKVMERKLLGMTHIGGTLSWLFGVLMILWAPHLLDYGWLRLKLLFVLALTAYHFWCVRLVREFSADGNTRSHVWYRWFNEIPTIILIVVVILAVVKPW